MRGQKQAAEKQLNTTNAVASEQGKEANALESDLIPGYTSLMKTGYLSPEEESAATTSEMGAATAPFESMQFREANESGATRNPASLTAGEDKLALEEGQASGDAASRLQQEKMQNQEAGMYGLSDLEKGNMDAMEKMYGLGPGTLEARAAGGGWSQGFKDVMSSLPFSASYSKSS